MKPIQDVLNRIKWDKKLKPGDYTIEYLDFGKLKAMAYTDIKRIEEGFMIVGADEAHIPLHRVRIVRKKGEIVWQR
ncbi:MAG: DUF504 domain-containing protein [Candidatus Woesearchaeota archaeon]